MKILYVADAQSIHTQRLAEYFRDLGADVYIASFRPARIHGVKVYDLPTLGLGRVGYFIAIYTLRKLFREIVPDIVHAQHLTSYGYLSAVAGLHPLVLSAWGSDVLVSARKSRLLRWFASYALRHANSVVTMSEHMNPSVALLGVSADKINVVPFGVDSRKFLPPASRLETVPLRLICTRALAPIYSVDTLLLAIQQIVAQGINIEVDIVGDGPLRNSLELWVLDAGLQSWVTFHGHLSHMVLPEYLAKAHIFVSPALSDGNNVSLNEAMSCGCFPIATDIPANAQWITPGVNGLLYPAGDSTLLAECILRAISDVGLRAQAGVINRKIVETSIDWVINAARMNEIYVGLIRDTITRI